jgi:enolase
MSAISHLSGRQITDSRGEPTLEVEVVLENGVRASASVPHGKSKGGTEVLELEVPKAIDVVSAKIMPALKGIAADRQREVDQALLKLDNTPDKSVIGGNTTLAVSLAVARASALDQKIPLWKHIAAVAEMSSMRFEIPRLLVNLIEGGLHAEGKLVIQEHLIIPTHASLVDAVSSVQRIYNRVEQILVHQFGRSGVHVGDEGGFWADFIDPYEPFSVLRDAALQENEVMNIRFGIDAAASNIEMQADELKRLYLELIERFQLAYIEDPYAENQHAQFADLNRIAGNHVHIVGDDLTTTNVTLMRRAHEESAINGIIIKPNQIGTLTETIEAVKLAKSWGWFTVVSHRSGETMDTAIADIAIGLRADGFKLGAHKQPERAAKYHRLKEIALEAGLS